MKYISEEMKFGANIVQVGVVAVTHLSLPLVSTGDDQRDKSHILVRTLYLSGLIKVLNFPE